MYTYEKGKLNESTNDTCCITGTCKKRKMTEEKKKKWKYPRAKLPGTREKILCAPNFYNDSLMIPTSVFPYNRIPTPFFH